MDAAVAVYEVDADMAACLCARVAGVSIATSMDYSQCRQLLADVLDTRDEPTYLDGDGDGASDFLGSALAAVGVEPAGDPVSVLGLIRRIYKHAELFAPQCDRVLHHHTAAIVAIQLLESSKLLVAIDQKGCVCVWDPCAYRVSITVKHAWTGEIPGQPAFLGNHPYTLVQRIQLHDNTTGGTGGAAHSTHPHQTSKGKSHMCVTSVAHLGIPTMLSTTFPCSRHEKTPTSLSPYAPSQYPTTASPPPSI